MKILMLASGVYSEKGGIETYNQFLISAVQQLGHSLRIVSMNDMEKQMHERAILFPCGKRSRFKKARFVFFALREVFRFKPDTIFCGHVNFAPLCWIINKLFRVPYTIFTHGVEVWNLTGIRLNSIQNSQKIAAVSNYTKQRLIKKLGDHHQGEVFLLFNTFDQEQFKPTQKPKHLLEKWNFNEKTKILFTLARLSKAEQYKGYDKVISVMRNVLKEVPEAKYLIGGTGDDVNRIKSLIQKNGLNGKVILTGFIDDNEVEDYYNLCDIYVMPSKGEGFGIVFLEALSCGKLVIAGNSDGSRDPLLDGELGILVDPDNLEELEKAICDGLNKKLPAKFYDAEYLRKRVVETYGFGSFKNKVKLLLS